MAAAAARKGDQAGSEVDGKSAAHSGKVTRYLCTPEFPLLTWHASIASCVRYAASSHVTHDRWMCLNLSFESVTVELDVSPWQTVA